MRAFDTVRSWLVALFARTIMQISRPEDREAAVQWLAQSRDIVASDRSGIDKARSLNALIDSRAAARAVSASVGRAVTNYRQANLPLSLKIAIPATLAAMPLVGGQAAGVAAFGGAIGLPVLLLIFLGATGITSIIEVLLNGGAGATRVGDVIDIIIADERLRRASAEIKAAMRNDPVNPERQDVPPEEMALRRHLLNMDPYLFEHHVMSFFRAAGLPTTVTRKSNDFGIDGFAVHDAGMIVVQCKRNAPDNKVGRPVVQQFKGVVEEQGAYRGYVVTSSTFTDEAHDSAKMSDKIELIDITTLVSWHRSTPVF